jgi:hypothetical protein
MSETFPTGVPHAIVGFHMADRLKSEIMLASRMLGELIPLPGEQMAGGRLIFASYLKGLDQEVMLASYQIKDPELVRVKTVCTGLIGMAEAGELKDIQEHLTWMITVMATFAQRAMEYLQKQGLL